LNQLNGMKRVIANTWFLVVLVVLFLSSQAQAGWEEGVAAFNSGNYEGAVTEFQELIKQDPESWQFHFMLALSLDKLDRNAEAMSHIRKAYELNPTEESIWQYLDLWTDGGFEDVTVEVTASFDGGNEGDAAHLTFTLRNTGIANLSAVSLTDSRALSIVCTAGLPVPALLSGATTPCTADTFLTSADVTATSFDLTMYVNATGVTPDPVTAEVAGSLPLPTTPVELQAFEID